MSSSCRDSCDDVALESSSFACSSVFFFSVDVAASSVRVAQRRLKRFAAYIRDRRRALHLQWLNKEAELRQLALVISTSPSAAESSLTPSASRPASALSSSRSSQTASVQSSAGTKTSSGIAAVHARVLDYLIKAFSRPGFAVSELSDFPSVAHLVFCFFA